MKTHYADLDSLPPFKDLFPSHLRRRGKLGESKEGAEIIYVLWTDKKISFREFTMEKVQG